MRRTDDFMQCPSPDDVKACYQQFFDATSAANLTQVVCGVCAREVASKTSKLIKLYDLPHRERLAPSIRHVAHTLYDGCLLEPAGVVGESVQLYPKLRGYRPSPETLQRAMHGTVSTFAMDTQGVAAMVEGALMPRKPAILASLISITFVGRGKLPKNCLKHTFRVRRQCIRDALIWLWHNNTTYYGDIIISEEHLALLPDDDIPQELAGIVRHCSDDAVIEQEHNGYVPSEMRPDAPEEQQGHAHIRDIEPAVIPLNISGSVDLDLTRMTASELMQSGLFNLWQDGQEGGYAIRHGSQPIRDFSMRELDGEEQTVGNVFERAFPCLFPYGVGGIERLKSTPVDFHTHVRWCMQYYDRRFRRHESFAFYSFGISQRRQALGSARVQMRRKDFERDAFLMATITAETLAQAQREEQAGLPFSSPAIRTLQRHLYGTAGHVQGMNQARQSMRSQIWSTVLVHGPPSLWLTINPSDLHDPIAQVFAGEHIDVDNLLNTPGPDVKQRAINIAADPYAAAKFFHFLITTIFETLFGIHVTSHTITCNTGVLGRLAAYLGAVESQARAALHQHCIIWLKNAPSSDEMLKLLKDAGFHDKVIAFIRRNVRAYLPGLESAESVAAIPVEKDIAYNRPPNPAAQDYEITVQQFELRLARSEQIHSCKLGRCLKSDHRGLLQCKRRAPFAISTEDFVNESGEWGAKRLYEYVNGWNPAVLVNARCNNDIKLLTNGEETRKVSFYVSGYTFKKQNVISNLSAIMADGFAYHMSHPKPEYVHEVWEQQRLLLFRLVNAINREQELAAPMVMSYLMGWGDIKHSHMYTPVYWSSFVGALCRHHPNLHTMTRLRRTSALQWDQPYSTVEGAAAGDENLHNVITSESPAEDADHKELVEAFAAEVSHVDPFSVNC
ncbi:hypothetical protein OBBRIDRAFT_813456 [Obba rivulosa]|uniref:Helitron helicase-like domain-containing protein n=1 Tax=Obba rivulosa TaxID=1052685 RepID=A0A8E2AQ06_9APHY|nr:hypothetical protein OBBRIDRAFT_813456 [Obba rivulosa]